VAAPNIDRLKIGTVSDSPPALATFQPGQYEIDTRCSEVMFSTRHLFGLAAVHGSFAVRTGTVNVAEPPSDCSIHAEIETASFRTGNWQRDKTVLSAGLLDVGQYPVITFMADQGGGPVVAGVLTAHGVSRPVTLAIELSAVSSRSFTARASTRIDRTEFGVTAYRGLAGRYLDVSVEVRCVRN
jgi:polyisoprenoid-binding protein YceI